MKLLKGKESKLTLLIFLLSFFLVGSLIAGNISDGYTIFKNGGSNDDPVFWNTSDDATNLSVTPIGTCIENNTNKDYFVPTRTKKEWDSFVSVVANPLNPLGLKLVGCDGDKECRMSAGENCAIAPNDCGSCGSSCSGTISYGGESYGLVQIGGQCWLNRNLNIGSRVNFSTYQTNNGVTEKYCVGNTNDGCTVSGGLYSYMEAMNHNFTISGPFARGICPEGWHIPSMAEFTVLRDYLGGGSVAGGKLKKTGTGSIVPPWNFATNWLSPNTGATNSSLFNAVPGRINQDSDAGKLAGFRTTDMSSFWLLSNNSTSFSSATIDANLGLSVRCIRDIEAQRFFVIFKKNGNGTLTGNTTQILYGPNKNAEPVTASSNSECLFVNWSDGYAGYTRNVTNVTNHITLTANFNCTKYTLQYNTAGSGSITGNTTQSVFSGWCGSAVTATPAPGYKFFEWTDGSKANPRTDCNVTGNINVAAKFVEDVSGCGVCGTAPNKSYCPNLCYDGGRNMTNCVKDLDCHDEEQNCQQVYHPCVVGQYPCTPYYQTICQFGDPRLCDFTYYIGNPDAWHCEY